jgi:hypothetical protein
MLNPSTTVDSPLMKSSNLKACVSEPEIELQSSLVQAWPVREPATPFVDGIHAEAICQHLQAVTEGRDSQFDH